MIKISNLNKNNLTPTKFCQIGLTSFVFAMLEEVLGNQFDAGFFYHVDRIKIIYKSVTSYELMKNLKRYFHMIV